MIDWNRLSGCSETLNALSMSESAFWRNALKVIKARRALLHGVWKAKGEKDKGERVCALAAFAVKNEGKTIHAAWAERLQRFNDSMPEVTPQERRKRVIAWLQDRVKETTQVAA